ncbi:MAG TPA: hypothetical protein VGK00_06385 [Anaerolineales bacterium]|jgi:hypothetical protein
MKDEVGLWIDHKKSVIVIGKGGKIVTLKSNLEENIRLKSMPHGKTPSGTKTIPAEDQHDRHISEHLNKYYTEVISYLRAARAIIIMGPGEAKFELEKRLNHEGLKNNVLGIESADKLTERQIVARVKLFFSNQKLPAQ